MIRLTLVVALSFAASTVGLAQDASAPEAAGAEPSPLERLTNEIAIPDALIQLRYAQDVFRETDKDGNGALDYADSIAALVDTGMLPKGFESQHGYRIALSPVKQRLTHWGATASPIKPGVTGRRHFASNQSKKIFHALAPIALNESGAPSAKGKGAPLLIAEALPGFDPTDKVPAIPSALYRSSLSSPRVLRHFREEKGEGVRTIDLRGSRKGWRVEQMSLDLESGESRHARTTLDVLGRVKHLRARSGNSRSGEPGTMIRGEVAGKVLRLRSNDGGKQEGVFSPDMVPEGFALFALAPLAAEGKLKLPVTRRLLADAFAKERPLFTLEELKPAPKRPGATSGERAFAFGDGQRKALVWIAAKGKVLAFRALSGKGGTCVAISGAEAAELANPKLSKAETEKLIVANEKAVIGALKKIRSAQSLFREGDMDRNNKLDYANGIEDLVDCNLLARAYADGPVKGYQIAVAHGAKAPEFTWMAVASPAKPGKTGNAYFAINQAGVIHRSDKPITLDAETCKIEGATALER